MTTAATTAAADTDATNAAVGRESDASAATDAAEGAKAVALSLAEKVVEGNCDVAVDDAFGADEVIGTHDDEPVAENAGGR